jgi:hypothetical protein
VRGCGVAEGEYAGAGDCAEMGLVDDGGSGALHASLRAEGRAVRRVRLAAHVASLDFWATPRRKLRDSTCHVFGAVIVKPPYSSRSEQT